MPEETWAGPFSVVLTYGGYGKQWGRRNRVFRCNDVDHARNLARKQIRERGSSDLVKVTVWLDDNHCAVWSKNQGGWHPVREQKRER